MPRNAARTQHLPSRHRRENALDLDGAEHSAMLVDEGRYHPPFLG
jgi:hypothetical protein